MLVERNLLLYSCLLLLGTFVGSISQVLLKKSALQRHSSGVKEYLNPLVILAYVLFVGTTLLSVYAYKVVPLSMGPILEATSYLYVAFFGWHFFEEKITVRKIIALGMIVSGIVVFSAG